MKHQFITDYIEQFDNDVPKLDGLDEAIIGLDTLNERIVYDKNLIIQILARESGDTEEALDYFGHSIESTYMGEHTPIYVQTDYI